MHARAPDGASEQSRGFQDVAEGGKILPADRSPDVEDSGGGYDHGANSLSRGVGPGPQLLAGQVPLLRAVARGLCRNASEAEDLVQDTLEKALRSIDALDIQMNPRGWMVTILHNLHVDRCRQRARQGPHIPCGEDVPLVAPERVDEPAWYSLTTDDVLHAAALLPSELREAYTMFALEGRTYIEIAAALGIPKATVGTRILRARTYLRKLLVAELRVEST